MCREIKLFLISVVCFATAAVALLAVAELLLRHSILSKADERRNHVRATTYMPVKFKSHYRGVFWGVPFVTNRYGFRDEPDFEPTPRKGEVRILSVGDSIGFGLGIPAHAHYTKVLERQLNKNSRRRHHVVNAAGQGYSPSSYYVYLQNEGLKLQPDMVIVDMEMCSVISNEALLRWEVDPTKPGAPVAVQGGRYLVGWDGNMLATYSLGGYFFEKTYVYTDLLRRWLNLMYRLFPSEPFRAQERTGVCYYNLGFDKYVLNERRLELGWEKTFGALKATQERLQEEGIPLLVLIFPARYMFNDNGRVWGAYAASLMRRAVSQCRELGLPFLDLTPAVKEGGGTSLYFDFAHMTAAGNRVVGDALFHRLRPQLLGSPVEQSPSTPRQGN